MQQEGVCIGFLAQEAAVVQKASGSGMVTLSGYSGSSQAQVVFSQGQFVGLVRKQSVQADEAMDKEDSTGVILQTAQTWAAPRARQ